MRASNDRNYKGTILTVEMRFLVHVGRLGGHSAVQI